MAAVFLRRPGEAAVLPPAAVEPLDDQRRRLAEGVNPGIVDRETASREELQAVKFVLDAVGEVDPVWQLSDLRLDEMRRRCRAARLERSEEHTSELQSLMRISYAVFCFKKKK